MTDTDVTLLLDAVNEGDEGAYDRLMAMIYEELKVLARSRMRNQRAGHTLQPTVLVNEAYMRLLQGKPDWQNRAHFFGAAAEAMRRVLVDHARRRASQKRGGDAVHVTFNDLDIAAADPDLDMLALDEALAALKETRPRLARVVTLRYFAGLSIEQTAAALDLAPATVKRDWTYAKAWLYERMTGAD